MKLSIIIVNWNTKDLINACIDSILKLDIDLSYEIIIIDNASFDGIKCLANELNNNVTFIQNYNNVGFGKANNIASKLSRGDTLLFLNPDTEFISDSITVMYEHLISINNAGAIGCTLLNSDLSLQPSSIQSFPTIFNQVIDSNLIRKFLPFNFIWGNGPLFKKKPLCVSVDTISGACMMVKREAFEAIGGFSPEYFMYSEDIDLCKKMENNNYKRYFINTVSVLHHHGGSSSKVYKNTTTLRIKKARYIYFLLHKGNLYADLYRLAFFPISTLRLISLSGLYVFSFKSLSKGRYLNLLVKWFGIYKWSIGIDTQLYN